MQVKEIGKWLIALCMSVSLYAVVPIGLDLQDSNGRKIESVQVGVPFFIDIEIVSEEHASVPKLQADPAIITELQGSRSSVYSINGHRTVSKNYRYLARAHDEGVFTIGPAIVMVGGRQEESEVKKINVQVNLSTNRDAIDSQTQAYVEIATDAKTVYKGQEVTFSLRLYMQNDDVHIEGIQEPTFTRCTAAALEGPFSGHESINGIDYKYLEWKTKFYAHEAGTLLIPSVGANVIVQQDRGGSVRSLDLFSMMGSILGTRAQHKQLLSNALKLEVLELPATEKKVAALGSFTSFTAKTNLDSAQEGEGIVLTLELVGQGNFAMIQHPPLQLPDGLQSYESNTAVNQLGAGVSKKDFEYIVQATRSGTYTIPAQECTYFDKNKHAYKTLTTKPLQLVIARSADVSASSLREVSQEKASQDLPQHNVLNEVGKIEENSWQDSTSRALNFKTFIYLILVVLLGFLGVGCKFLFDFYREKNAPYRSYNMAFNDARNKLKFAQMVKDPHALYDLWIKLFALRLRLPVNAVTQDRIQGALLALNFEQAEVNEWNAFFTEVMAASYANKKSDSTEIYEQSKVWLDRLEGKL